MKKVKGEVVTDENGKTQIRWTWKNGKDSTTKRGFSCREEAEAHMRDALAWHNKH